MQGETPGRILKEAPPSPKTNQMDWNQYFLKHHWHH